MSCLVDLLRKGEGFGDATQLPVSAIGFDGLLMVALQLFLVEFQCFLLGSLGGIGHITLVRFLDTIDITLESATDEDFTEEGSSFLIFQTVDGEDFSALYISQTKDLLDFSKPFLELALIQKHRHI